MIPKIIHYCWFGGNPKNDLIKKCITSWKTFLPDYEIKEWNETNIGITDNEFMNFCYKEKKWAYVADYARLLALKEYGGIYLDTDMEVIKPFPEQFRTYTFLAGEEVDKQVSCGIIGAVPGCSSISRLIEYYDKLVLLEPIPLLLNDILVEENNLNSEDYFIPGSEVFYPMQYDGTLKSIKNSYTIHHWEGSWKNNADKFYSTFFAERSHLFSKDEKEVLIDIHIYKKITLKNLIALDAICSKKLPHEVFLNLSSKHRRAVKQYIDNNFIDPPQFSFSLFLEAINNPYLKNYSVLFYCKLFLKSIIKLQKNKNG